MFSNFFPMAKQIFWLRGMAQCPPKYVVMHASCANLYGSSSKKNFFGNVIFGNVIRLRYLKQQWMNVALPSRQWPAARRFSCVYTAQNRCRISGLSEFRLCPGIRSCPRRIDRKPRPTLVSIQLRHTWFKLQKNSSRSYRIRSCKSTGPQFCILNFEGIFPLVRIHNSPWSFCTALWFYGPIVWSFSTVLSPWSFIGS